MELNYKPQFNHMLNLGLPYCVLPYKLRTSKLALSHLHIKAKANFGSDLAI